MNIIVFPGSDRPIYAQIYDQITRQIITGELKPDSAIPTIRAVAAELGISVIPVKRAWEELERDGLIYTVVGRGSFVKHIDAAEREARREETAVRHLRAGVEYCRSLGISPERTAELVSQLYGEKKD